MRLLMVSRRHGMTHSGAIQTAIRLHDTRFLSVRPPILNLRAEREGFSKVESAICNVYPKRGKRAWK